MSGGSYEFTFVEPGEYDYYCMVHPWMTGKIMVSEFAEIKTMEGDAVRQTSSSPSSEESQTHASPEEIKAMVTDAIALYDEIGTDSFESFNSSPDFHKSDLYMFVFRDSDSIMVAHGANMELIGESVDKILDIYGESIGKMVHDKATKEGAWIEYLWWDPTDNETHPKIVWAVKHDGYIFGTGSYSDAEPTSVEPQIEPSELRATSFEVIIPVGSPLEGCENLNTCYVPYQAEINSGESIIWNNIDSAPHTITSGASETPDGIFDSGLIMASESFEFTFTEAGEYDYYCTTHPWMTGKIIVA